MVDAFNIASLFFESAQQSPDKVAIHCENESISFAELEKKVTDTAAYFLAKGIRKGDRVLVFVPMSIDLYRIVLALFHIGAVAVFLDEWVNKKRLERCCEIASCKAFIASPKLRFLAFFLGALRKIPIHLGLGYSSTVVAAQQEASRYDDTALITFTTGSTGTPKAAIRTHGLLHEQFKALIEKIDPKQDDIDMPLLPIVLLINLGAGCSSVICRTKKPGAATTQKIVEQIRKHRVSRLVSSPIYVKELASLLLARKESLPSIKKIFTGGAPVFPTEAAHYQKAFPTAKIEVIYGSTEAEPISAISLEELIQEQAFVLQKGLKVGQPYRKTKLKIINYQDAPLVCATEKELEALELAPHQIGEIIVTGPHVLQHYLHNDEAFRRNKIVIDGSCWHRTGDSGYVDEQQYLYLTGRCANLIKRGDALLAPFVYEGYFQSIEGIAIGTILHINDEIIAVLELTKTANKKRINTHLEQLEAPWDAVRFLDRIPRDPRHQSKIDYAALQESIKS